MLSILLILFGTIVLVWLAQYHWKRRRLYMLAAKLKGPSALPIIGNALSFAGSNADILNNAMVLMKKYKSPVPVWFGNRLFLGITEAKHLEVILNHPNALEKDELYKHAIPCVGLGLFSAPVPQWKRHRKMILPTFNQKILDGFVEIFSEQSIILTKQLEKHAGKGQFDVFEYFILFTLDAICETAMGLPIHAQTTDAEFVKWVNKAMEIGFTKMAVIWYHFDCIFNMTSLSKEFYGSCTKLREFTGNVVRQKRLQYQQQIEDSAEAQLEEVSTRKKSFLQQFIELSASGEHLTDTEILDEVVVIMIGGSETTASINAFTLIMLGMHPDIQEKVYMEVMDAIGTDKPVEYTDLPNLPYTELVIKETMRLFPVGPIILRSITGDIELEENILIPGGCSAAICTIHVHRDPNVWPNPLTFDPLRFLPEECAKRHPYSYIPFSGGPRNCIGLKYAMMAMKAVIATIVRKYYITTSYQTIEEIKIKQDLVLKPIDGYGISIEARN